MTSAKLVDTYSTVRIEVVAEEMNRVLDWIFENDLDEMVLIIFKRKFEDDDEAKVVFDIPVPAHMSVAHIINELVI